MLTHSGGEEVLAQARRSEMGRCRLLRGRVVAGTGGRVGELEAESSRAIDLELSSCRVVGLSGCRVHWLPARSRAPSCAQLRPPRG